MLLVTKKMISTILLTPTPAQVSNIFNILTFRASVFTPTQRFGLSRDHIRTINEDSMSAQQQKKMVTYFLDCLGLKMNPLYTRYISLCNTFVMFSYSWFERNHPWKILIIKGKQPFLFFFKGGYRFFFHFKGRCGEKVNNKGDDRHDKFLVSTVLFGVNVTYDIVDHFALTFIIL